MQNTQPALNQSFSLPSGMLSRGTMEARIPVQRCHLSLYYVTPSPPTLSLLSNLGQGWIEHPRPGRTAHCLSDPLPQAFSSPSVPQGGSVKGQRARVVGAMVGGLEGMKGPPGSRSAIQPQLRGFISIWPGCTLEQSCKIQDSSKSPRFQKMDEKLIKQTFDATMKGSRVLHGRVGGKVWAGFLASWRRSLVSSIKPESESESLPLLSCV